MSSDHSLTSTLPALGPHRDLYFSDTFIFSIPWASHLLCPFWTSCSRILTILWPMPSTILPLCLCIPTQQQTFQFWILFSECRKLQGWRGRHILGQSSSASVQGLQPQLSLHHFLETLPLFPSGFHSIPWEEYYKLGYSLKTSYLQKGWLGDWGSDGTTLMFPYFLIPVKEGS